MPTLAALALPPMLLPTRAALACLAAAWLMAACGGAAPAPSTQPAAQSTPQPTAGPKYAPAEVSPAATAFAPAPFTAAQIRAATRPGRTYLFRLTVPGRAQAPLLRELRFVHAHSRGGQLSSRTLNADRSPRGEPTVNTFTWAELVSHASYPKASTTVTEVSHTVPAGTFDCLRYEVRQGPVTTTAYFAKALPGAPIRHSLTKAGTLESEMVLLEYKGQ